MCLRITLILACALALPAQVPPGGRSVKLESHKTVGCVAPSDEILKAEYQKSLHDARELSKLANDLKTEFEKNDYSVLSVATVHKTEDIDKLSKRIRGRLKRCW
jgi:hypothetical protein